MVGQEITYKEVKEYKKSNCIIRVHIPDLTEEERARRMNELKRQVAIFMKEVIKVEKAECS